MATQGYPIGTNDEVTVFGFVDEDDELSVILVMRNARSATAMSSRLMTTWAFDAGIKQEVPGDLYPKVKEWVDSNRKQSG
jgi:hypothetical protein